MRLSTPPERDSGSEANGRARPALLRLDLAVARRGGRDQVVQEVLRDVGDLATARSKTASFACDGFCIPLTLRTYWSAAAWISSRVVSGSKL